MKRWIFLFVFVVGLGSAIAWRLHLNKVTVQKQAAVAGGRKKAAINVDVAVAKKRDMIIKFEGTADVQPSETVNLAPKTPGLITYVAAHEGDSVSKDEVVVRLDPSEIQAAILKDKATIESAQARLVQASVTQSTVNTGIGTNIEQMIAGVASAKADYNLAVQTYDQQVAAALSAVTDAQGRLDSAKAQIVNVQASLRSAQANLDNANSKLSRLSSLYTQNFIAAQDVDDQKTLVSVQKGAVDVADAQLNAADSAKRSAEAQLAAAKNQADIAKTKGQSDIDSAKARLVQAQQSLINARANTTQKPAYAANLLALKADVDSAKADLTNSEALLVETILKSPVSGYVTLRPVDPGSLATVGQTLIQIQQLNPIWINLPVPEEQIAAIEYGQQASVTFDALHGHSFAGTVTQINPSGDQTTRNFTVRLTVPNPNLAIKPGMYARVSLVARRIPGATVVPVEAIQMDDPTGPYAWVVRDNQTVEKRPIVIGASDTNDDQVKSGLLPGDKVVTLYTGHLRDGGKVRVNVKGRGAKHKHAGASA